MTSLWEKKLADNEALMRRTNEQANIAAKDYFTESERERYLLEFACECADLDCRHRIVMTPETYQRIHSNRKHFIVKPGHDMLTIERVIKKTPGYHVVEKFSKPAEV